MHYKSGAGIMIKKNTQGNWETYKAGSYSAYNTIIDSILKRHEEAENNK